MKNTKFQSRLDDFCGEKNTNVLEKLDIYVSTRRKGAIKWSFKNISETQFQAYWSSLGANIEGVIKEGDCFRV